MTVLSPLKTAYSRLTGIHTAELSELKDCPPPIDRDYFGPAIVSETIRPQESGRIQFQGSWWSAWCEQDVVLTPGKVVQVIGRRNITLLVQPV
ncbi:MAG: NfeD family protein [Leptolyngbyaceae cyanobacterium bins.349]|nr:NfeD family protein [Leptolyngbyaceae cyanobacterium bins.349]